MNILRFILMGIVCMIFVLPLKGCAVEEGANGPLKALAVERFDEYGGIKSIKGTATGFFHTEKIGDRWLFVTPDGNGFWSIGVDLVSDFPNDGHDELNRSYMDNIVAKYGDKGEWSRQTAQKLVDWKFNSVGAGSSSYVDPIGMYWRPPTLPKIAKAYKIKMGFYSSIKDGVANILEGAGAGGYFPDVYDPRFATRCDIEASTSVHTPKGDIVALAAQPWVLGYYTDEELRGFGKKTRHIHLGFAAGAAAATTYTKQAWRDYLQVKYGTLVALNAAYNTSYTEWGSNGSTGVLDETGRNLGHDRLGHQTNANIREDQFAFMFELSTVYFKTVHDALRKYRPNHLILGPMMSTWDSAPWDEILLAAAPYVDVFGVSDLADHQEIYELTGKPTMMYTGWRTAEPDSPIASACGAPAAGLCGNSQEERAQNYRDLLFTLRNIKASDGSYPVVGAHWWKYSDNGVDYWMEKRNFGFVTKKDNAYDGVEARIQTGRDARGFDVGGEVGDYGDFISGVIRANQEIMYDIANE